MGEGVRKLYFHWNLAVAAVLGDWEEFVDQCSATLVALTEAQTYSI